MRIIVIGDPHGTVPSIDAKGADAIICTGDFIPDAKLRRIVFAAMARHIHWQDFLPKKQVRQIIKSHTAAGMKIISWMARQKIPTYIIPGNWDAISGEVFYGTKLPKSVQDCDGRIVDMGDFVIVGFGWFFEPLRNLTPQQKKTQSRLEKKYDELLTRAKKKGKPIMFLTHNPPFGTKLDKVRNKDSPANGLHVGSPLVRKMILKHKPAICISGHMHENSGFIKLGKTQCLNAGCLDNKYYMLETLGTDKH